MVLSFVKKPVKILAVQWDGHNYNEIKKFTGEDNVKRLGTYKDPDLVIHTLEGDHHALIGDWIIRGVNGEFYPCKPDIFEKNYEKI